MNSHIIVHYNEIGIKGKNRNKFENQLMDNIRCVLKGLITKVYKRYGLIVIPYSGNELDIKEKLELLPGIANFSFAICSKVDLIAIQENALKYVVAQEDPTFKIKTRRSNKQFPLKSPELNKIIGQFVESNSNKTANMHTPDILLRIEIGEKEVFFYNNKHKGVGGLPIGSGAKVVCSLSGGIDSPISAFQLMKRGCEVVFVHIYNNTLVKGQIINKIKKLVKQLTKIQLKSKLYIVPFSEIQNEIIANIPSQYRMIVYRRYMLKLINQIAIKEKAKAIVTGDSVGQVASQTIENITCIWNASQLPVLAPLISFNKDEIIEVAKKIGTYELSIEPYPDCCSFMIAKHPETKANLSKILELETSISSSVDDNLTKKIIEKAEIFKFN